MAKMTKETYDYKRFALGAARDFGYGAEVIAKIKASTDQAEISKYLERARLAAC